MKLQTIIILFAEIVRDLAYMSLEEVKRYMLQQFCAAGMSI